MKYKKRKMVKEKSPLLPLLIPLMCVLSSIIVDNVDMHEIL